MQANNRAENSHLPVRRRERKQQKFKSKGFARRLLATHAAVDNSFSLRLHLVALTDPASRSRRSPPDVGSRYRRRLS